MMVEWGWGGVGVGGWGGVGEGLGGGVGGGGVPYKFAQPAKPVDVNRDTELIIEHIATAPTNHPYNFHILDLFSVGIRKCLRKCHNWSNRSCRRTMSYTTNRNTLKTHTTALTAPTML
jgi:hypothetical protein